jgi:outer membrane protein assembly factor BamB
VSPVVVRNDTFAFIGASSETTEASVLFFLNEGGLLSNSTLPGPLPSETLLLLSKEGIAFYSNGTALTAYTGSFELWRSDLPETITHVAVDAPHRIIIVTTSSALFALGNSSGLIVWEYSIPDGSVPLGLLGAGNLTIVTTASQTIGVDANTGLSVWTSPVACTGAMALASNCALVCVSNMSGSLSLLEMDLSKHLIVWSTPLPPNVTQADVIVDLNGTAVAAWTDGATVTVVAYKSGLETWSPLQVAGTGVKLAVQSDGDMLVLTHGPRGELYTIGAQ